MKTSSSGARRAAGWVSCVVALLMGCTQQSNVSLKLPSPKPSSRAALGGAAATGSAQFDAPVVDPNTWSGAPMGTGQYSVATTPPYSGGPASIAAIDSGWHYVVIGNFNGNTGTALAVLSDAPWTVGSRALDGVHRLALIFDVTTGDAVAEADSGTVTLTVAGGQLGQRVTGSLTADFVDLASPPPPPQCQTSADCARGEVCQAGVCVVAPAGCTSNAQCAAGQVCQAGQCVPSAPPACVVDADCPVNQTCQAGVCVSGPTGCTSNLQCPRGYTCQAGACVSSTPATCSAQQGSGSYSGGWGGVAQCTAAGSGAVALSNGQAWFQDDGALALVVADSSSGEGVLIQLSACPSAAGAVSLQNGQAVVYAEVANAAADAELWVAKRASGGTLTFTSVGAVTAGTFQLAFSNGGSVTGSFTVQ